MTISARHQIFDRPVNVSDKDVERLQVHLCNWQKLHEIMLLGVNEEDLRRLVIMELASHDRERIISRLLGRLAKAQRQSINERIAKLRARR